MGPTFESILISILPMLLLIGAWIFFMRRMNSSGDIASLERRKVEALERIAVALEMRS